MVGRAAASLISVAVAGSAWAAPTLQVVAEPPSLLVGQTGTLHIMVISEGGAGAEVARGRSPSVPTEEGLDLRYRGMGSRFSASGGRIVSVITYQYSLDSLLEGTWDVGPVEVTLADGSILRSDSVQVVVKARDPSQTAGDTFQVTAGFDELQAWEGQLLLYHYSMETTLSGVRAGWKLPAFDGLRQPQYGQPIEQTYQVVDGDVTITTVKGSVPLIATGTGSLTIPPAIATVEVPYGRGFGGWRQQRQERRATEPQTLVVKRLPPAPADFSGIVGDVTVRAVLERNQAAVGESIGLTLSIQSDGSLEGLAPPPYSAPGVSVYDDASRVDGQVGENGYRGVASFRRVLVPIDPGTIDLPPVSLVTFSPKKGEYVTHSIDVGDLVATPGREGTGEIESFATDDGAPVEEQKVVLREPWTWGFVQTPRIGLAIPILLVGAAAPGAVTMTAQGLVALRRRWRARKVAALGPPSPFSYLRGLPDDVDGRLAAYDAALRQALANRQGVDIGALDRDAAVATLPAAVAKDVRSLTRGLDSVRYGGRGVPEGLDAVVRRVLTAVEKA